MSQNLAKFTELLSKFVFCEERLDSWKLNPKSLQQAFHSLDFARRGSLNVSDLFRSFPDFSQQQLFYVFKVLDFTRSGRITLDDLLHTIAHQDSIKDDSNKDPVSALKFYIKMVQMNYQEIEKLKRQIVIDEKMLLQLFSEITMHTKNDRIKVNELIFLVENFQNDKFSKKAVNYITDQIFHREAMSSSEFVAFFRPFSWNQIPKVSEIFGNQSYQTHGNTFNKADLTIGDVKQNNIESFYNHRSHQSGQKSYERHQPWEMSNVNRNSIDNSVLNKERESSDKFVSRMGNQYLEERNMPYSNNWMGANNQLQHKIKEKYHQHKQLPNNWKDQMTNNSNYIEKRREELKKGSIQREKIIQNIMAKRSTQSSTYQYPSNFNFERPKSGYVDKQSPGRSSQLKNKQNKFQRQQRIPRMSDQIGERQLQHSLKYDKNHNLQHSTSSNLLHSRNINKFEENSKTNESKPYLYRPVSAYKSQMGNYASPTNNYSNKGQETFNNFKVSTNPKTGLENYNKFRDPELNKYSRTLIRGQQKQGSSSGKQNILKRAQEEASRKIQQIQRKARMKVMEKRSALNAYNKWLK